jgi:hypothetical protein
VSLLQREKNRAMTHHVGDAVERRDRRRGAGLEAEPVGVVEVVVVPLQRACQHVESKESDTLCAKART